MQGYKVEVKPFGESSYSGNGLVFRTASGAQVYGADLAARWTAVEDWRVVAAHQSPPAPGENTTVDWAEAGAERPSESAPAWRVQL